ncbi:MAG: cytochrome b/b6 domain-containing protein [Deltaproteobacteria bacterium]|nr:cytochrome b/b6 domain-containing protein [Deltaproteobacteria bacterium]
MTQRWSSPSIALHWLTALALVVVAGAGLVLQELPSDALARRIASGLHAVGGLSLAAMTLARLVVLWRKGRPEAAWRSGVHALGVRVVHVLTYVVLLALSLSGFVTAKPSTWHEFIKGEVATAPTFEGVASRQLHEALVVALVVLVTLHVLGVLVDERRRGGTMRRMLPW